MFFVPFFQHLEELCLLIVLLIAAFSDLSEHRVSNRLLLAGFSILFLIKLAGGEEKLLRPLVTSLLFLFILLPLHRFRMIGAADIKTAALILFCRPDCLGAGSLMLSLLLGALLSLYRMLKKGIYKERFQYLYFYLRACLIPGCPAGSEKISPYYDSARDGYTMTIPLASCYFTGTVICFLLAAVHGRCG